MTIDEEECFFCEEFGPGVVREMAPGYEVWVCYVCVEATGIDEGK